MLEKWFLPDTYAKNVFSVNLEALKERGITLILCDIDNTLAAYDDPHPDEFARAFIQKASESGIEIVLISNNTRKRVSGFADKCKVQYYCSSLKPLKRQYKVILKEKGRQAAEAAVIGDQLLTDICGGKRMKLYTILTSPLYTRDIIYTRITRIAEMMIYLIFEKQKKLIKGEYYGEIL